MMSERREWWILQYTGNRITDCAYRDQEDVGEQWKSLCVHVREVLPGDDTLVNEALRGQAKALMELDELAKRHAALVEAAREFVDWGYSTDGMNQDQLRRHRADFMKLRKALENE